MDLCGWKDSPKEVERIQGMQKNPFISPIRPKINRQTTLLYQILEKVTGQPFPVRNQAIGDCVAQGAAGALDCLVCTEIWLKKEFERWIAPTSAEVNYALGRHEVGKGALRGEDGSYGGWQAQALKQYGSLIQDIYLDGKYDLRQYSGKRSRTWGDSGLPDDLEPIAREHIVKTISVVKTLDDVEASLTNGYPITIASNQGFSDVRDNNGFSEQEGTWPHQMFLGGIRYDRPGVCVINSWGNWNRGPRVLGQPVGSFWITFEVLMDRIIRSGDCWALSNFEGYPEQKLSLRWF